MGGGRQHLNCTMCGERIAGLIYPPSAVVEPEVLAQRERFGLLSCPKQSKRERILIAIAALIADGEDELYIRAVISDSATAWRRMRDWWTETGGSPLPQRPEPVDKEKSYRSIKYCSETCATEARRDWGKARRQRRKAVGLCLQCPRPALPGRTHCAEHAVRRRYPGKNREDRVKAQAFDLLFGQDMDAVVSWWTHILAGEACPLPVASKWPPRYEQPVCDEPDCTNPRHAKGLCSTHYSRSRKEKMAV